MKSRYRYGNIGGCYFRCKFWWLPNFLRLTTAYISRRTPAAQLQHAWLHVLYCMYVHTYIHTYVHTCTTIRSIGGGQSRLLFSACGSGLSSDDGKHSSERDSTGSQQTHGRDGWVGDGSTLLGAACVRLGSTEGVWACHLEVTGCNTCGGESLRVNLCVR